MQNLDVSTQTCILNFSRCFVMCCKTPWQVGCSHHLKRRQRQLSSPSRQFCVKSLRLLDREGLGLPAGAAAVSTNGRVVVAHSAALNVTAGLVAEDFLLLEQHAATAQYGSSAVEVVVKALDEGRCALAGRLSDCYKRHLR